MRTLIKKEFRLLLPAWITVMLLAVIPGILNIAWISTTSNGGLFLFVHLMYAAGVLFLGIHSFGEEISCHTFSGLLSQPMNRPRIWLVKVATLATAFISVWLAAILVDSWQIKVLRLQYEHYEFSAVLSFLTLSALAAFSGGLWTTLWLRQVTGAFWFTLLTPLAIILGVVNVFQDWIVSGKTFSTFIVVALVLYSIAGFFLAWRLFMRAQDIQWSGGEISLPRGNRTSKFSVRRHFFIRPSHPFAALAWKELQLHQGIFMIAGFMLMLHLAAVLVRKFHPHIQNPNIEAALNIIWLLWLLLPLLIGAAAIAEERRLDTLEPQLCLPVSRRKQLFVKFFVGLILSLFFGALAPVLIEGTGTLDQWPQIVVVATVIFLASFYASSLGRTPLQSIGLAILVALVIRAQEFWDDVSSFLGSFAAQNHYLDAFEIQIRYLDAAILLILYGWLTLSNFRHAHQNWKTWIHNILAVLAVFVCFRVLNYAILTAALEWYGRHYL
ncbi:MAG TPA: ABC transporter permease [Verrucomicrobiae bacterium]|nr:ABC transporter permease [Verrucomicrobiae bacterium]